MAVTNLGAFRSFILTAALLLSFTSNVFAQNTTTVEKIKVAYSLSINVSEDRSIEITNAIAEILEKELLVRAEAGRYIQNLLPATAKDPECLSQKDCLLNAARTVHSDKLLLLVVVGVADEIKIETTVITDATKEVIRKSAVFIDAAGESPLNQLRGKSRSFLSGVPSRPDIQSPETTANNVVRNDENRSEGSGGSRGRHINKKTGVVLGLAGVSALAWIATGSAARLSNASDDTIKTIDFIFAPTTTLLFGIAGIFYLTSGDSKKKDRKQSLIFSADNNHGIVGVGGVF